MTSLGKPMSAPSQSEDAGSAPGKTESPIVEGGKSYRIKPPEIIENHRREIHTRSQHLSLEGECPPEFFALAVLPSLNPDERKSILESMEQEKVRRYKAFGMNLDYEKSKDLKRFLGIILAISLFFTIVVLSIYKGDSSIMEKLVNIAGYFAGGGGAVIFIFKDRLFPDK